MVLCISNPPFLAHRLPHVRNQVRSRSRQGRDLPGLLSRFTYVRGMRTCPVPRTPLRPMQQRLLADRPSYLRHYGNLRHSLDAKGHSVPARVAPRVVREARPVLTASGRSAEAQGHPALPRGNQQSTRLLLVRGVSQRPDVRRRVCRRGRWKRLGRSLYRSEGSPHCGIELPILLLQRDTAVQRERGDALRGSAGFELHHDRTRLLLGKRK